MTLFEMYRVAPLAFQRWSCWLSRHFEDSTMQKRDVFGMLQMFLTIYWLGTRNEFLSRSGYRGGRA